MYKFQHSEGGGVYGVYAKEYIPAFSVLGQYTGTVHRDENQDLSDNDRYP